MNAGQISVVICALSFIALSVFECLVISKPVADKAVVRKQTYIGTIRVHQHQAGIWRYTLNAVRGRAAYSRAPSQLGGVYYDMLPYFFRERLYRDWARAHEIDDMRVRILAAHSDGERGHEEKNQTFRHETLYL